jgi:hypothetical protein
MILVKLTELPSGESESVMRKEILDSLCLIKECFMEPKVIDTLMGHLADCLQTEEKTVKHN